MTATHDRRSDPRAGVNALNEWGRRSAFGSATGWPWWAVVVLALGLSVIGAFIDMHTSGNLGKVFEGAYFLGCVGAVCLVRRRNLFGPTVQPPLILAVTIPLVVLLTKGLPSGSGMVSKLLALGVPLVTGFPTMAITTGATLLIGGIRFLVQRKPTVDAEDEDWGDDDRKPARRRPADRGEDAPSRRPGSGSGRPSAGRSSRDERDGQRERGSAESGSRGRGEAAGREGRPASGRSASERARGEGRDRESGRSGESSRGRKPGSDRGQSERGRSGERGQAPRGSQSRSRGQAPRGERPSRDDGRRQPPPRRRDDD